MGSGSNEEANPEAPMPTVDQDPEAMPHSAKKSKKK